MKKGWLILLASLLFGVANAQVKVYQGGELVYELASGMIDSVVFAGNTYIGNDEGGGSIGGNEDDKVLHNKAVYIKHPFDGNNWEWRQMTETSVGIFEYVGEWHGVGFNVNTIPDDDGKAWFAESDIQFERSFSYGEEVVFVFISENGIEGVAKIEEQKWQVE